SPFRIADHWPERTEICTAPLIDILCMEKQRYNRFGGRESNLNIRNNITSSIDN
uniref:Uncharacterized protein n=1 Tax=Parascaris univalens TaxID=6257 RepID=A0A915BGA1_PARUN